MKEKVILFAIVLLLACSTTVEQPQTVFYSPLIVNDNSVIDKDITVEVTLESSTFTPRSITILQGTRIIFVNTENNPWWVASDTHPLHTDYPFSDARNCGTGVYQLESCGPLGETMYFSFIFRERGTWYIHNHIKPENTMVVRVE